MASRNGKSSSTGLRFLWIPGRKKHQHKGRIEATRSQPTYGQSSRPRPNEPWSLGGSRGQEQLLKDPISDTTAAAACSVAATDAVINHANSNVALVEANSVDAAPPASPASESSCGDPDASSGHYGDDDGAHNTATLLISDKKTNGGGALRKKNKDLDSIDRLDDNGDCVDAIKMGAGRAANGGSSSSGKHRDAEEKESTVTCLYYTLQCCECNIM